LPAEKRGLLSGGGRLRPCRVRRGREFKEGEKKLHADRALRKVPIYSARARRTEGSIKKRKDVSGKGGFSPTSSKKKKCLFHLGGKESLEFHRKMNALRRKVSKGKKKGRLSSITRQRHICLTSTSPRGKGGPSRKRKYGACKGRRSRKGNKISQKHKREKGWCQGHCNERSPTCSKRGGKMQKGKKKRLKKKTPLSQERDRLLADGGHGKVTAPHALRLKVRLAPTASRRKDEAKRPAWKRGAERRPDDIGEETRKETPPRARKGTHLETGTPWKAKALSRKPVSGGRIKRKERLQSFPCGGRKKRRLLDGEALLKQGRGGKGEGAISARRKKSLTASRHLLKLA